MVQGELCTLGMIGSHVDDFLIVGNEQDKRWSQVIEKFHASMRWSLWEVPPLTHCGVELQQLPDGGWRLDQASFCSKLSQIKEDGKHKDLTAQERTQCRAILGAVQWRVYQTGPQHAAKLDTFSPC